MLISVGKQIRLKKIAQSPVNLVKNDNKLEIIKKLSTLIYIYPLQIASCLLMEDSLYDGRFPVR